MLARCRPDSSLYHWFIPPLSRNRGTKFFIVAGKTVTAEATVSAVRSRCTIRSFSLSHSYTHIYSLSLFPSFTGSKRSIVQSNEPRGGRRIITGMTLKSAVCRRRTVLKVRKKSQPRNFVVERGWHLEHPLQRHSPAWRARVFAHAWSSRVINATNYRYRGCLRNN